MSSKFAGLSPVQKPPAVCKKQPPPEQIPWPPFWQHPIQAYAEWSSSEFSEPWWATGYFTMSPTGAPYNWEGHTPPAKYALRLQMYYNQPVELVTMTLTLTKDGFYHDQRTIGPVPLRNPNPFDTGMLNFDPQSTIRQIYARAML